jgi:TRAP-type C4-dicarboxylate transport system substrate-binding protein
MMEDWAKLVHERTKNRVKIEVYPAGQLYTDKDLDRALSSGAVDLGQAQANVLGGMVPAAHLLDFSMLWDNWAHFDRVIHEKGGFDIIDEDARAHSMKEIFIMPYGLTNGPITNKKKIVTHEDMKGLKIRAMGGSIAKTLVALGATPVFIGAGEVYQALQRGTIDGAVSGPTSMADRGWGEISKYYWTMPYCPATCGHTVMNLNAWNKLPADIQKIFLTAGREIELKYRNEVVEKENKDAFAKLQKAGVELVHPTQEEINKCRKLVQPVIEEWANKSKPARELVDLANRERGKK